MAAPRTSRLEAALEAHGKKLDALSDTLSTQLTEIFNSFTQLESVIASSAAEVAPVQRPPAAPQRQGQPPRRQPAPSIQESLDGSDAQPIRRGPGRPPGSGTPRQSISPPPRRQPVAPVSRPRTQPVPEPEFEGENFAELEAGFEVDDASDGGDQDGGDWGEAWQEEAPAAPTRRGR